MNTGSKLDLLQLTEENEKGNHEGVRSNSWLWNSFQVKDIDYNTGREDSLLIKFLIIANRPRVILETGSCTGITTTAIIEAIIDCPAQQHKFLSIEWDEQRHKETCERVLFNQLFDPKNCELNLVKGDTHDREVYKCLGDEKIDFAFVDDSHRAKTFDVIEPLLSEKAIVVFHDGYQNSISKLVPKLYAEGRISEYIFFPTERTLAICKVSKK